MATRSINPAETSGEQQEHPKAVQPLIIEKPSISPSFLPCLSLFSHASSTAEELWLEDTETKD